MDFGEVYEYMSFLGVEIPVETIKYFLDYNVGGMALKYPLFSFMILFFTFVTRRFIVKRAVSLLEMIAHRTNTIWDNEIVKISRAPIYWSITVLGVWLAFSVLPLSTDPFDLHLIIGRIARISLVLILTLFFFSATDTITEILKEKAADPKHWMDTSLIPLLVLSLKVFTSGVIFVLVMQNLGYSVSALVASLGIGGIAVAFAAQGILANFFGSLMIMMDRPFKIGDWIQAEKGEYEGIVEEIGFRSTKIRTFEKTVQIIPNDKLSTMILENMDRRKDKNLNLRRIKMTIGLEYKTSAEKLELSVQAIRDILEASEYINKRQIYVYFSGFGDFSLDVLVYFYANTANWRKWLEIKHDINILIMKKLDELEVVIAYPTQSIHLEKSSDQTQFDG